MSYRRRKRELLGRNNRAGLCPVGRLFQHDREIEEILAVILQLVGQRKGNGDCPALLRGDDILQLSAVHNLLSILQNLPEDVIPAGIDKLELVINLYLLLEERGRVRREPN